APRCQRCGHRPAILDDVLPARVTRQLAGAGCRGAPAGNPPHVLGWRVAAERGGTGRRLLRRRLRRAARLPPPPARGAPWGIQLLLADALPPGRALDPDEPEHGDDARLVEC